MASQRRDTAVGEGTSRVPPVDGAQSEAQGETPTQPLPAPPPTTEIPREIAHPVPPPLPSDQDLRSSRVQEFIALSPPEFTGTDQRENPQDFIN